MANTLVQITKGRTRSGVKVSNIVVELLEGIKTDKDGIFITVDGNNIPELRNGRNRIYLNSKNDYIFLEEGNKVSVNTKTEVVRTDEEISKDLLDTFKILGEMTDAGANGIVRGLVVSGPAGIGKSFTIMQSLENNFDGITTVGGMPMYEVISGCTTPVSLYAKLYEFSEQGKVLVFDDSDGLLFDQDCLNLLKAALDSKKVRKISWNANSHYLEEMGVPNSFEFKAGIIFVTNLKFDQVKSSKIAAHLEAIISRCHYMDIGIDTAHERLIHIRNTVEIYDMMHEYNFSAKEKKEVMDYIFANYSNLRELSLRMVLKIASLRKSIPNNWVKVTQLTCHRKAA
jgi:hypothetical protein